MLREGLFSSKEFVKASQGYVLLRLTPGPAESYFGITCAPMAAVSDWHGRVIIPNLNLRGDIARACSLLESILKDFDRKKAEKAPAEIPEWATKLVAENSAKEMGKFLASVHPSSGTPKGQQVFADLEKLYPTLEVEGQIIAFCTNYTEALKERTPPFGKSYSGYAEECTLLENMSYAKNDSIKFKAIACFGEFAPVNKIAFLVKRIEEKNKDARNPNVVYCRCLSAIGSVAKRYRDGKDEDTLACFLEILKTLPVLSETLKTQGRNNSACSCASNSAIEIIKATGSPKALLVAIENLNIPTSDSDWLKKLNDRYAAKAVKELEDLTDQSFGTSYSAWLEWYKKCETELFFDFQTNKFGTDKKKAQKYRKSHGL